jgi:hypothetical protein
VSGVMVIVKGGIRVEGLDAGGKDREEEATYQ